ncbi:hypothetical protein JCM19992_33200 [Thermostilla marina]
MSGVFAQGWSLPQALPPSRPMTYGSADGDSPAVSFFSESTPLTPGGTIGTIPPAQNDWLIEGTPEAGSIVSRRYPEAGSPLFERGRPLAADDRPADARTGFFQGIDFKAVWLASGKRDGLGVTALDGSATFAVPAPSRDWPLLITPDFTVYYLTGPKSIDVPPRLYDAYTEFRWLPRLGPNFRIETALQIGAFSDFEQSSDEAFRITGRGLGIWDWRPGVKLVGGVAYLDRYDIDVLPVGGIIWKPNDLWEFNLLFPKPKIARRILWHGALSDDKQDWFYVAGDYNPHVWAVERVGGFADELTYRDVMLIVGLERRNIPGIDYKLELGYVFSRRLHYRADDIERELDDTVMLRAIVHY